MAENGFAPRSSATELKRCFLSEDMQAEMDAPPSDGLRRWGGRHRWRWAVMGLLVVAMVFHGPLLSSCVSIIAIEEPLPKHIDAVLILHGDDRHSVAATWLQEGFTDQILLARERPDRNI